MINFKSNSTSNNVKFFYKLIYLHICGFLRMLLVLELMIKFEVYVGHGIDEFVRELFSPLLQGGQWRLKKKYDDNHYENHEKHAVRYKTRSYSVFFEINLAFSVHNMIMRSNVLYLEVKIWVAPFWVQVFTLQILISISQYNCSTDAYFNRSDVDEAFPLQRLK